MKYLKYLNYVLRHKWFVLLECFKAGCIWRGIVHDLSKFLPDEFFPYAKYFYGNKPETDESMIPVGLLIQEKFNIAWLKHIHRNPHHWQYWVLREDDGDTIALKMPDKYAKEMLCDWRGAGRAQGYGDNTKEWYGKNKDKMLLHHETKAWIERNI